MVEKVDAEFVVEQVPVDRLYHRQLLTARMQEIEELEKKWNCKILFPGTEQASDIITVSGPEYQVPQAVDEFLGMVPETHEIEFPLSDELRKFLTSNEFRNDTAQKLKDQYVVEVSFNEPKREKHGNEEILIVKLVLSYTRNNAGGLKDAIDFLLLPLMARGLDQSNVKGAIPRPKSDSFEDSMPYFESKLLQRAEPPLSNESPTRPAFEDGTSRSIFDKLRKPSSMASFSSFIDRRRKNGTNSPASSLFMHASNNASKASLVSMESRDSGYRHNPWNDSGIDLDHESPNPGIGPSSHAHAPSWGSFVGSGLATSSRPNTSSASLSGTFPFGASANASTTSLNTPMIPGLGMVSSSSAIGTPGLPGTPGDVTPKFDDDQALDGTGRSTSVIAAETDAASLRGRPGSSRASSTSSTSATSKTSPLATNAISASDAPSPVPTPAVPVKATKGSRAGGAATKGAKGQASGGRKAAVSSTSSATASSAATVSKTSGYPAPIGPPR